MFVAVAACDEQARIPTVPSFARPVKGEATIIGANLIVLPIVADAINNSGQATGTRFVWTPGGSVQDIGTLGGVSSVAVAINDVGQVAGTSFTAGNDASHAFLWTPDQGMRDLGTLGGRDSHAYGLNDRGYVVGESLTASGDTHAFLWTPGDGMRDLGTLGGLLPNSRAYAVNNVGQVVGAGYDNNGPFENSARATFWEPGQGIRELGTLGGTIGYARDINDKGQVVGMSQTATGSRHAFLWTPADGMRDLGTLGGTNSAARAINAAGQVVGLSEVQTYVPVAFLWTAADGMENLYAASGIILVSDINDRQQVLGGNRLATLQLSNQAPIALVGGPYTGEEGTAVAFAFAATDADGDALTYAWDLGDGTVGSGNAPPTTHVYADDGAYSVRLTVTDGKGGSDTKTTTATIANVAPTIHSGGLTGPTVPVELTAGTGSAPIAVTFTDPAGQRDTYAAEIQCGNGTTLSRAAISSPFIATCTYSSAGVYTVRATVSDEDGGTSEPAYYRYVVVFDREGGFATGSGFFAVPGQAKAKAHFSFSVKFLPGRSRPDGNAKFWVPGGQVDFVSTAIDMLVVSGNRAQFWGMGLLNGASASFRITVVDAQAAGRGTDRADAFRIELWRGATLVFDTQSGAARDAPVTTPIEGGSIQIHSDRATGDNAAGRVSAQHSLLATSRGAR